MRLRPTVRGSTEVPVRIVDACGRNGAWNERKRWKAGAAVSRENLAHDFRRCGRTALARLKFFARLLNRFEQDLAAAFDKTSLQQFHQRFLQRRSTRRRCNNSINDSCCSSGRASIESTP